MSRFPHRSSKSSRRAGRESIGASAPREQVQMPVQCGQVLQLTVHGLASGGDGVARHEGFTLFVPGGLPGDLLRARVMEVRPTFGRAALVEVLQPGPDRVAPPCPVQERCGGCPLMGLSYAAQLVWKQQQVQDAMARIGHLPDVPVHATRGMESPWGYRGKVQVPVGWGPEGVVAGFYAPGTHEIIPMESCHVQHPVGNEIVQVVRELAAELGVSIYDERTHTGLLRHVLARVAFGTGEAMCVLVTNGERFGQGAELARRLMARVPAVRSVVQNINARRTNVILGEESRTLAGQEKITERLGELTFALSARSFFQVNPVQTQVLYEHALSLAGLTGQETVIDAYCGIGTISLFLARGAQRVIGIEVVPEAVLDARENARCSGLPNAEFLLGEVEVLAPQLLAEGLRPDVVVVDPPRKGCEESALAAFVEMAPRRIVYVSCNPATLARDLAWLGARGYRTLEVQPVDMFPHTAHVECVAVLVREG